MSPLTQRTQNYLSALCPCLSTCPQEDVCTVDTGNMAPLFIEPDSSRRQAGPHRVLFAQASSGSVWPNHSQLQKPAGSFLCAQA